MKMLDNAQQAEMAQCISRYKYSTTTLARTIPLAAVSANTRKFTKGPIAGLPELSHIAHAMDVPAVVATYRNQLGLLTCSTYGLDLATNLAKFAQASDALCVDKAIMISNISTHPDLGPVADFCLLSDIRFFVGIPLTGSCGERIGSLAVLSTHKSVATQGISIAKLTAFGKMLTRA